MKVCQQQSVDEYVTAFSHMIVCNSARYHVTRGTESVCSMHAFCASVFNADDPIQLVASFVKMKPELAHQSVTTAICPAEEGSTHSTAIRRAESPCSAEFTSLR